MNKIIPVCGTLLLLAGGCNHHEDTGRGVMWRRMVEPHLTTTSSWHSCTRTLASNHVVVDARCDTASVIAGHCNDPINSREDADRLLVSSAQCTDAAVAALENLSRAEPAAMSDLAGAYYVRAQRNDDPEDLLRAFDTAQRAVALRPQPDGAEFNRALILEALSLDADAIEAWQRAAAVEKGEWASEARAHQAELLRARAEDGEHEWPRIRAQIDAAIDSGDVRRAQQMIAAFPAKSESYFEEDVLGQWAASPSPRQVARITTFGNALSQFFNDRYFSDVAAAISNAHSLAVIDKLRQGHSCFARARAEEASLRPGTATPLYEQAAELLQQARSPQCLLARIGHAGQRPLVKNEGHYEKSLQELNVVEADARSRRYPSVIAHVNLGRTNADQYADRYNDLFAAYEAVKTAYDTIGDWEDRAAADARTISAMSVVGLKNAAWREAFVAARCVRRVLNLKTRFLLIGISARAALDLDHAEAALRYQTVAVGNGPDAYVAIALRERAAIALRLQRYAAAQRDLDAAVLKTEKNGDAGSRQALEARLAEVAGEAALHADPKRAVELLTRAIGLAANAEYATFRANLFAERAAAFDRLGRRPEAESDRRAALDQLHGEEERLLRENQPRSAGDLWYPYFSRFQETYDLLIRQLIDEGHTDEAFRYAERARAFEPLDLVRKLPATPAAFRRLTAQPDQLDIAALQSYLPPGTYLIEYRVFEDRTYAWILSRDVFVVQPVPARRSDVKRWTEALREAVRTKDAAAFESGLQAPYEGLLKAPLDAIARAHGAAATNIVIVPDRELRGLPFAALRDPDTRKYVIEDYPVTISGSALLYVFSVLRDRDLYSSNQSALLIGDPAFDERFTLAHGLHRLPAARREVAEIGRLYPHAEVLTGDAATAPRFTGLASGPAIIHVAAHAVVNGDAPSQSFLLFTPSGDDHGVLNAASLIKELHTSTTRLAVLGACSSAGGLPVGAEGIAPLVRPIVAAGIPGIVGALWDIDDATAADLLVSFHRNYRQGSDAAAALQEAQLKMLRSNNPGLQSGLSWAPFQAIGFASSPFPSMGNHTKEKPP